ncbi:S-adenosylmethionine-binding protein [Caballeronia sp. SEWSISQ10-4 2]|uniref:S-adenosylmethionine-binding protein n=1 Tax=Caballeronia sp. SEWSISQ10-4 2 TaxID=2937438 RepID=UPI002650DC1C|nr:S-adenosylmethionine-binding protein [Caballeronia sp. SEWSISQ10-4 2]MDN7177330.1 S-adenosylmethionine-binding protein [Caballeronia sp. SEWSISQ10-4 2]
MDDATAVKKPDAKVFPPKGALELHSLSTLFPPMTDAEYATLKADIAAHGQRLPIVIHEGAILDGAHRYRVCAEIGVEPTIVEFAGDDPVAFVLSANLHRRHLTQGQQAAIVANAQDWGRAQTVGGDGSNQHKSKAATLPDSSGPRDTVASRAAQAGVSERTQRMADTVAKASPELAKQVAHGAVSLPQAIKQIKPADTEPETSAHDRAGVKPAGKPKVALTPTQSASSASVDEDAFGGFDAVAELEIAQKEIAALQEQVEALSSGDTAAELVKEIKTRQGIEARLAETMNKVSQLDNELRGFGKLTKKLRDLLGVEANSRIVSAVSAVLDALKRKAA